MLHYFELVVGYREMANGVSFIWNSTSGPARRGAVGPGFRHGRRYAKPPAATLLTGLAGGVLLSQFLLQLVCPPNSGRFCATTQEPSQREIPRL